MCARLIINYNSLNQIRDKTTSMGNLCTGAQSQMTRESLANNSYRSEAFSRRSPYPHGAAGAIFDQRYEQELKNKHN